MSGTEEASVADLRPGDQIIPWPDGRVWNVVNDALRIEAEDGEVAVLAWPDDMRVDRVQ